MGRGLSELQKKILVYTKENCIWLGNGSIPFGAPWFPGLTRKAAFKLRVHLHPEQPRDEQPWRRGHDSPSSMESMSTSRALRRLEQRGLISVIAKQKGKKVGRRAKRLILTPAGEAIVAKLAGQPSFRLGLV